MLNGIAGWPPRSSTVSCSKIICTDVDLVDRVDHNFTIGGPEDAQPRAIIYPIITTALLSIRSSLSWSHLT